MTYNYNICPNFCKMAEVVMKQIIQQEAAKLIALQQEVDKKDISCPSK